jgi:heme A synthase
MLLIAIMLVWAFREKPRGHAVRKTATLSMIFVLTEALMGAALVLFSWVGNNESVARAVSGGIHLMNTFVLLACLVLTAWWATVDAPDGFRVAGALRSLFIVGFIALMIIGSSGAIAALGNTLYPSKSIAEGVRQDFSATASFLVRLRILHPVFAIAGGALMLFIAASVSAVASNRYAKTLVRMMVGLVFAQWCAGFLSIALLAPAWLQLVHLFLADLVWIVLVLMMAVTLAADTKQAKEAEKFGNEALA